MAGPKKSRKPRQEADGDAMSDDSNSGSYHGQQEIQATFEGRNPEGQDFHGIKQLLNQLFLKAHVDISQMSDLLINQQGIGSVLKQSYSDSDEEEEDVEMSEENTVFGITSVVNLSSHKETPCIKEFYSLLDELSKKHAEQAVQDSIKQILSKHKKIGFLINERFVNIPSKISTVMLSSLYEEIQRIKKKDASYNFEYLIMICKTCRPKDDKDSDELFSNGEEEIFSKEAEVKFEFSVEKETDTGLSGKWMSEDKQVLPYRKVLIFEAEKLQNIIQQVTAFVES